MRTLLFLVLNLLCWHTRAQSNQYHPFPETDAQWNVSSQSCCASNCTGPPFPNPVVVDHEYSYFISGDTVINSQTYSRIFRSGSAHEHCSFGTSINNWYFSNNEYYGGLRQDTTQRTVFFIQASATSECLLYDFNLITGDTLQGNCIWSQDCAVVSGIDSVLVGTSYRKRFNLSGAGPSYAFIEGIGSTAGPFEPLCPFEYDASLICFSENGLPVYPDTATTCSSFTGTHFPASYTDVKTFPNPFHEKLNISLNEKIRKGAWSLVDIYGRIVKQGIFHQQNFTIIRGELSSGIYYLTIKDDLEFIISKTVLAQ